MTVHVNPERQDTIARATIIADRLRELKEDVAADSCALDEALAAYHAAGDDAAARGRAERRVAALLKAILEVVMAFAK